MKDATTILDGIVRSIETVGRSGSDDVYLDNVSFRVDARRLDIPHDSFRPTAEFNAAKLHELCRPQSFDPEVGFFTVEADAIDSNFAFLQILPVDYRAEGRHVNMSVTLPCVDAVNELPQAVLTMEIFLHKIASSLNVSPGHITFNVGVAFINWDDVTCAQDPEIEIPR